MNKILYGHELEVQPEDTRHAIYGYRTNKEQSVMI
jgi:hypothetical protein